MAGPASAVVQVAKPHNRDFAALILKDGKAGTAQRQIGRQDAEPSGLRRFTDDRQPCGGTARRRVNGQDTGVGEHVSELTADAIPAQTYTGSALTPEVTLRDGDMVPTEGTDYTTTCVNNVNAGTATIPITGQGNYAGALSVTFTIRAAEEEEDERDDTPLPAAQMAQMRQTAKLWKALVTARCGEPAGYEAANEEAADEATGEIIERTLIIAADPAPDEDGEIVLRDGDPVYGQRDLYLSQKPCWKPSRSWATRTSASAERTRRWNGRLRI